MNKRIIKKIVFVHKNILELQLRLLCNLNNAFVSFADKVKI